MSEITSGRPEFDKGGDRLRVALSQVSDYALECSGRFYELQAVVSSPLDRLRAASLPPIDRMGSATEQFLRTPGQRNAELGSVAMKGGWTRARLLENGIVGVLSVLGDNGYINPDWFPPDSPHANNVAQLVTGITDRPLYIALERRRVMARAMLPPERSANPRGILEIHKRSWFVLSLAALDKVPPEASKEIITIAVTGALLSLPIFWSLFDLYIEDIGRGATLQDIDTSKLLSSEASGSQRDLLERMFALAKVHSVGLPELRDRLSLDMPPMELGESRQHIEAALREQSKRASALEACGVKPIISSHNLLTPAATVYYLASKGKQEEDQSSV